MKRGPNLKVAEANRRRVVSAETRKKMSESGKNKIFTQEHRRNLSRSALGKSKPPMSLVHKQKIALSSKGRKASPEAIEKMKQARIKKWATDPYYRARIIESLSKQNKRTKIEVILGRLVRECFGESEICEQYRIGNFVVDWAIPSRMLAWEADGKYWHNRPGAKEKDAKRDDWIRHQGWTILRFDEDFLEIWVEEEDGILWKRGRCR